MEKKYFYKVEGKILGGFTAEELSEQRIARNTYVWAEGMEIWKKVKDIPELNPILFTLPPEEKRFSRKHFILFIAVGITLIATIISFWIFKSDSEQLLTKELLYENHKYSVVLIKHSFLYEIDIADNKYYFKNFDAETGETELLDKETAMKKPNISWGTGFFINTKGRILSCKHVVLAEITEEEKEKIFNYIQKSARKNLDQLFTERNTIVKKLKKIDATLKTESARLNYYDHQKFTEEKAQLLETYKEMTSKGEQYKNIANNIDKPDKKLGQVSLELGVFLNETTPSSLKDYIAYRILKVGEDENTDLAVLDPSNPSDLEKVTITSVDLSRIKTLDTAPVSLNEEVSMVGFNNTTSLEMTTKGITAQMANGNINQNTDKHKILYTIPTLSGASGSPVFDAEGKLISVHFAKSTANAQGFNYGIQPQVISNFLKRN